MRSVYIVAGYKLDCNDGTGRTGLIVKLITLSVRDRIQMCQEVNQQLRLPIQRLMLETLHHAKDVKM